MLVSRQLPNSSHNLFHIFSIISFELKKDIQQTTFARTFSRLIPDGIGGVKSISCETASSVFLMVSEQRDLWQRVKPGWVYLLSFETSILSSDVENVIWLSSTMRTNLLKLLDLLIFCKYSLNFNCFRLKFSNFVTNQLNISKFLPLQRRKTLHSY